jgi:hypothetical protein
MKIIFLDIDGVLNSDEYYRSVDRTRRDWNRFDPKVVAHIKRLIEEFSATIVISSTWRFGAVKMLNDELIKSGLKKYLNKDWKTPQVYPSHRGTEIRMWLDNQAYMSNYLILDDDTNILEEQIPNFVQTNLQLGMQAEHYYKAREILENI